MFDLITGEAKHIPSKPALPILVSSTAQAVLVAILIVPVLFFTGQLPEVPTMLAFVAAPPAPPPPPPPPPPPAAKPSRPPETQPVPTSGAAAPVEAPASIAPESVADAIEEGVPGGVEGGVPGGVLGGVVGGLPADIPPPPPPPPAPARRDPVRVGGQIKEPQLARRIEPVYHPLAVRASVQGTVILEAIVDKEGRVADVRVLRSAHRLLDDAAIEAVRQWQYVPLVLNGIPERFVLTVVLTFNLTQQAAGD
jgi:protein TonB